MCSGTLFRIFREKRTSGIWFTSFSRIVHVQEPVSIAAGSANVSLLVYGESKREKISRFLDAIDFRVADHMAIKNYV